MCLLLHRGKLKQLQRSGTFPVFHTVGSAPVGTDVCGVESLQSQSRLTIDTGFVT